MYSERLEKRAKVVLSSVRKEPETPATQPVKVALSDPKIRVSKWFASSSILCSSLVLNVYTFIDARARNETVENA